MVKLIMIKNTFFFKTAQMMILSLVAMTGLEKYCITSAYLQWLCHSGEQTVARGPLVHIKFCLSGFVHICSTPCKLCLWMGEGYTVFAFAFSILDHPLAFCSSFSFLNKWLLSRLL